MTDCQVVLIWVGGMICATVCFCIFWIGVTIVDYNSKEKE